MNPKSTPTKADPLAEMVKALTEINVPPIVIADAVRSYALHLGISN
jgi:hypothetical protein